MDKIQALHDYYEFLHAWIQSNLCLIEDDMDVHVPSIYKTSLRSISCIQSKSYFPNLDISFSPEYLPTELIHITTNSIQTKATTPEEQDLGNFTRINMKILTVWDEW